MIDAVFNQMSFNKGRKERLGGREGNKIIFINLGLDLYSHLLLFVQQMVTSLPYIAKITVHARERNRLEVLSNGSCIYEKLRSNQGKLPSFL